MLDSQKTVKSVSFEPQRCGLLQTPQTLSGDGSFVVSGPWPIGIRIELPPIERFLMQNLSTQPEISVGLDLFRSPYLPILWMRTRKDICIEPIREMK